jgi:hypothetical protein
MAGPAGHITGGPRTLARGPRGLPEAVIAITEEEEPLRPARPAPRDRYRLR